MSYSPWLSHHRHRRRHRHHSLPRRREGYVYRRVTMWHANDFKGNGFTTGRHGTSKMAGFGASRQPTKSSVNHYIRIFCPSCDRRKKRKSNCTSHGWRLLNTFYRYEVDLVLVWRGWEVPIISYSMSPVRNHDKNKILRPSPPHLEWWYGMVLLGSPPPRLFSGFSTN